MCFFLGICCTFLGVNIIKLPKKLKCRNIQKHLSKQGLFPLVSSAVIKDLLHLQSIFPSQGPCVDSQLGL